MAMALRRLALLACWLAQVESPALKLRCASDEYAFNGHCCRMCPAGTYVSEHCFIPHTLGACTSCEEGEDYTEHENGLEQCLPCSKCNFGNKFVVRSCTAKRNAECQCRDGYYCPPGCEECIKCKTKCPEGKVIVQHCSATTDIVCGSQPEGTTAGMAIWIWVIIALAIAVPLSFILWFICKIKRSRSRSNEEKDAQVYLISDTARLKAPVSGHPGSRTNALFPNPGESVLLSGRPNEESGNIPSAPFLQLLDGAAIPSGQSDVPKSKQPVVRIKNASSKKLRDIYFNVKAMVLLHYWNPLMRKCGLSDIDIDKITNDHPRDTNEQCHQMLRTLQDRLGIEDSLYKLLDGLWDVNLKSVYENVTNELAEHDLITVEFED